MGEEGGKSNRTFIPAHVVIKMQDTKEGGGAVGKQGGDHSSGSGGEAVVADGEGLEEGLGGEEGGAGEEPFFAEGVVAEVDAEEGLVGEGGGDLGEEGREG